MNRAKMIVNIVSDFAVLRRRSSQIMDSWWKGYSRSQRELLGILARHPEGTSIKELASIVGVSSSAITQRVESLQKLDLVERNMSSHDNRFVRVALSKKAFDGLRKALPSYARFADKSYFHTLDDEELKQFSLLMGKLAQGIEPTTNK
ncbi:MAG TPA: MarR family transcriptional regulator [Candidatus Saccharimonadales bacterium]|nr:MarR family transcriptional regulator [Candidatus Saccharimonadales bacterium]